MNKNTKGNKVKCAFCGKSYYDLGRSNHPCPGCNKTNKSNNKKFGNNTKPSIEDDAPSVEMELMEVTSENSNKAFSQNSGTVKFEFKEVKPGWYCAPKSSIVKGVISSRKDVFFLQSAPLAGLIKYLCSPRFKGIGVSTASEIVNKNSGSVIASLEGSVDFISSELGVNKTIAKSLQAGWKQDSKSNIFKVLLLEAGLTELQIKDLSEKVGSNIVRIVNDNPFRLLKLISRFGFEDVDSLAARLNIEISNKQRILAASVFYLQEHGEKRLKHTCLPLNNLVQRVGELTNIDNSQVETTINDNREEFVFNERKGREVVSTIASAERETLILSEIKNIINNNKTKLELEELDKDELNSGLDVDLSKEQLDAIELALKSSLVLITGGPGAGKTTLLEGLVRTFSKSKVKLRLCAPTGKAAMRIGQNRYLSKFKPSTIHMYLANPKLQKFDVMIVDEASMIDVDLMLDLLISVPQGSAIIFVGDADQLPPVGSGQPFKDFLESERFPTARLTGNFRQDSFSDTVKSARSIIKGDLPKINDNLSGSDFNFFECPKDQQADLILQLYFDLLPKKLSVAPIDLQILSPQRPGHVGILRLNEMIQDRITDKSKVVFYKKSGDHNISFYAGDKVIQRKNNYKHQVMNGDQGTIVKGNGQNVVVEFNGKSITLEGEEKFDLDLSYATTIHSSQGSEYPGVIIPVTSSHSHMLSRQLLYTAVTRGKRQVCMVGEAKALDTAIAQFHKDFRWTSLVPNIQISL